MRTSGNVRDEARENKVSKKFRMSVNETYNFVASNHSKQNLLSDPMISASYAVVSRPTRRRMQTAV
jgi:hypothetical protein